MRLWGREVRCVRGGREVFSGLSFEVSAGEALAVTGRNGSGKTSLLRLIAGLLAATGGVIAFEGADAELTLPEQAHYLGHRDAAKPALSVAENLAFWRDFLGGETADTGSTCRPPISRPGSADGSRSPGCLPFVAPSGCWTSRRRRSTPPARAYSSV
jgi:heme exporter protein A